MYCSTCQHRDLRSDNLSAYPSMNETRQEAEGAESDVDERICATYTALDPYCNTVSKCAYEVAEDAIGVPATGGKRMARKARKTSLESHMSTVIILRCVV